MERACLERGQGCDKGKRQENQCQGQARFYRPECACQSPWSRCWQQPLGLGRCNCQSQADAILLARRPRSHAAVLEEEIAKTNSHCSISRGPCDGFGGCTDDELLSAGGKRDPTAGTSRDQ